MGEGEGFGYGEGMTDFYSGVVFGLLEIVRKQDGKCRAKSRRKNEKEKEMFRKSERKQGFIDGCADPVSYRYFKN